MLGAASALKEQHELCLYVATVSPLVGSLTKVKGEKITYYILPFGKGNEKENKEYEPFWKKVRDEVYPDVVHIHGTEFSHGLAYVKACGSENVVVSIQGLVSAYYYYYYGITARTIMRNITIRDFFKGNTLYRYKCFKRKADFEKKLLLGVRHIIGRTSWDRARTWAINPDAEYHFCNETLREEFYKGRWTYEQCLPHTIFLSQVTAVLKGFHMLLQALPLVRRCYPDVKVRVAGQDITHPGVLSERIKLTDYGKFVRKMIRKYGLEGNIIFLGALSAEKMKEEYLKANVFVCSSSIENSPNSLGEAQLLGVPCISSYVGGTMDMIPNTQCGELYRYEEYEMLAYKICEMFEVSPNFDNTIMRSTALERHDGIQNSRQLLHIYKKISGTHDEQ